MFDDLESMAAYCFKIIKEIQPGGAYRLAGYSFGAHLAIAVAEQLIAAGDTVEFLGLLEGWAKFPPLYLEESPFRQRMQRLQAQLPTQDISIDLSWQRMQLLLKEQVKPLPARATLFKAMDSNEFSSIDNGYNHWLPLAKHGIDRYLIPGDHDTILAEAQVQQIAQILQKKLSQVTYEQKGLLN